MRNTEEEIWRERASYRGMVITPAIITAMQTYAEQEAVGFAEWKAVNGYVQYKDGHYCNSMGESYTTHQLYAIYKEKQLQPGRGNISFGEVRKLSSLGVDFS